MNTIEIDKNLCINCGLCALACPIGILKNEGDNIRIIDKLLNKNCLTCGHCVAVCPNNALSLNGEKGMHEELFNPQLLQKQLPLLIKQRRSVRHFTNKPVTIEDLLPILENLRYSPSAKNAQQVGYTLLTGKSLQDFVTLCYESVKAIEDYSSFYEIYYNKNRDILFRNAPALLLAHAPRDRQISVIDCSIALTIFDLLAPLYNIGSCWAGYIINLAKMDEKLGKSLDIKEDRVIYGALLVGHSAIQYASVPNRKPLDISILN